MVSTYKPVNRSEKAAEIAASPMAIRRNGSGYYVRSQSQPHTEYWCNGERCTCPDYQKRQPVGGCKHMRALGLHLAALASQPACEHCGHHGDDVVTQHERIGGGHYQQITACRDRVACWGRWDRQHGLAI